jgi:excisionase family DNA binding protein
MTCRRTTPTGVAPDMLTIEEAARVMRIGRSAAYKLAREYLTTEGTSGIPAMRIGGQLRVPRHMLEEYIGGPITWPIPDAPVDQARADEMLAGTAEPVSLAEPIQLTGRRATRRNGSQLALGLDS